MPVPALYPFIMLAAICVGGWLLRRNQESLQLPTEQRIAIGLSAFCGAMLWAKLPFLISDLDGLRSGTAWFASGKTIMCGMVGAYFAVEACKWTLDIRTKTGDSFVVPVAVSVGIGRLGCLAAGCCYGVTTSVPWAMRCAVTDDLLRHPTQIYESIFHLGMAALLYQLKKVGIWKGQLAKFYILSYMVYRLATEFIRPEAKLTFGLTGYQYFAIVLIPVFAFLWWVDQRSMQSKPPADSPRVNA